VSTKGLIRVAIAAFGVLAAGQSFAAPDYVIDPPVILGKYYEQNGARTCGNTNECVLRFSAVPAGNVLSIAQVSCSIQATHRPIAAYLGVYLSAAKPLARGKPLPIAFVSSQAGPLAYDFVVFADTAYRLGSTPTVWTTLPDSTGAILKCQIAGTLSP
jgi:hypothetical protein